MTEFIASNIKYLEFVRFFIAIALYEFFFALKYKRLPHFIKRYISVQACLLVATVLYSLLYFNTVVYINNAVVKTAVSILSYIFIFMLTVVGMRFYYSEGFSARLVCGTVGYAVQHIVYNYYIIIYSLMFDFPFSWEMTLHTYILSLWVELATHVIIDAIYILFCFKLASKFAQTTDRHKIKIAALTVVSLVIELVFNAVRNEFAKESLILNIVCGILISALSVFVIITGVGILEQTTLENENILLDSLIKREKTQYELKKEYMDLIGIKCHDIKHLISSGKSKSSILLPEEIEELNRAVSTISATHDTGSDTLDIVLNEWSLYCERHNVDFSCVADARSLSFLSPSDTFSLFGNIMENAATAAQNADTQNRFVYLSVKSEKGLTVITEENGFASASGALEMQNGLPKTTNADKLNHGFGVKSIRRIAEKYDGILLITAENNIFRLTVSIPENSARAIKSK